MKILHILDHSLPLHSGYTFRSQNIFLAQEKNGFTPIVLTSPKHEENLEDPIKTRQEIIDGIKYYRTGFAKPRIPFFYELFLMGRLYKRIKEIIKIEKPDIIQAHSPVLNGFPAYFAAKKFDLPFVYEIRAFWEDAAVDHGTYTENSFKYKITRNLETFLCKKASHIAVLCEGIKQDLVNRGIDKNKITPVFNGIDPAHLKPAVSDSGLKKEWNLSNKKIIGFVGSFYRYEGLDLLVKAFASISKTQSDAFLLLVGGGEMKKELEELVNQLGINEKVLMPGRIDHSKIAEVYSIINILCYPRYSMRLTELVTPLKPLEAMAMKKALVASDVGGHKELIINGKNGLLFKAGNLPDLKKKLSDLLDSETKINQLQEFGLKWVNSNHKWSKTTFVYKNIYNKSKKGL